VYTSKFAKYLWERNLAGMFIPELRSRQNKRNHLSLKLV